MVALIYCFVRRLKDNRNHDHLDASEVIENIMQNMSDNQDSLFAKSRVLTTDFCFDEKVVKVFDDMIKRSVPVRLFSSRSLFESVQENLHFYVPKSVREWKPSFLH